MKRGRLFKRRYTSRGSAPGAFSGGEEPTRFHILSFNRETLVESTSTEVADLTAARAPDRVAWIDVRGLGDEGLLREVRSAFEIHPLAMADIVNVGQRPKVEDYGETVFWVLRMARVDAAGETIWEQVSLVLKRGVVITFQEHEGDCFEPVRQRLRQGREMIRSSGSDYLAAMAIDAIIDGYFPVLERLGDRLEAIEAQVIEEPSEAVLGEIYHAKRELMHFRRSAWPLRDSLNQFLRDRHPLTQESTRPYLRDATDHAMQVVEVIETYRELAGSFIDVYLSSVSNRTNEVMRTLTVLASIFIPLTFLSGIYGMNFDTRHPLNLPELSWRYGYPVFLAVCALTAFGLMGVFWRLGWLGGAGRRRRAGRERREEP